MESNNETRLPLTDIQLAYIMGRDKNYEIGGVSTHAYYEVEAEVDLPRFEEALNAVIESQPMLRTVIEDTGTQKILNEVPYYNIETHDISKLIVSEQHKYITSMRDHMSHEVFTLNEWPMFAFKAAKIAEKTIMLFFSMDLLIADGSSIAILSKEIMNSYQTRTKPPALKSGFSDYLSKVHQLKNSKRYQKDKEYWLSQIDNIPLSPGIPMRAVEPSENVIFSRLSFKLPQNKWTIIKNIAKQYNVTPTVAIATAYSKTLGYWSISSDFTLNCTLTDRTKLDADADRIIGDFTSALLLSIDYKSINSTVDFWKAASVIQHRFMSALRHNSFNGIEVLNLLSKKTGNNKSSLMPIVFTSMLLKNDFFDHIEDVGKLVYGISQTPQVYLDCQVMEVKGDLFITWDYVKNAFEAEIIEKMFGQFTDIISNMINKGELYEDQQLVHIPVAFGQ